MIDPWVNRGNRDPAEIVEAEQAQQLKYRFGCAVCTRRAALMGGNGKCKQAKKGPGCGFVEDVGMGGVL
jgi:hypothetical protein